MRPAVCGAYHYEKTGLFRNCGWMVMNMKDPRAMASPLWGHLK